MKPRFAQMFELACGAALMMATVHPAASADLPVDALDADLNVDRVVLLMRHGVRPPTKAPAMPADVTAEQWPEWPVNPGWLTPHGGRAVAVLGVQDRLAWAAAGLLPRAGCPAPGTIAILADSDERTIATAQRWAAAVVPGCPVTIEHQPQDVADPIFSPTEDSGVSIDPAKAAADVAAAVGPDGIAGLETAQRPLLRRLDAILCGTRPAPCGVSNERSGIVSAKPDKRPKFSGGLDRASTAAQILLLEYAEGKPMAEVGWGRATAADVGALSAFHALEFRILARPRYLASINLSLLAPRMVNALTDDAPGAARVTMISGHDTNVASLAGLLDLHWQVPGVAADDPVPGGAILLERLRDARGSHYVRAVYRAQRLDEIRTLSTAASYRTIMPIRGCHARGVYGLCTLDQFRALMAVRVIE